MKVPPAPPDLESLYDALSAKPDRLRQILVSGIGTEPTGSYLHWDQLRHRRAPEGFTHEEWWLATKVGRTAARQLPVRDKAGRNFAYCTPDSVQALLHGVDRNAAGDIQIPELVATAQNRDKYIVRSLMEEAINSSQLEGAATTYKVAKEMLQRGRKPRDKSEHMIVNNYVAMQFIRDHYRQPLTPQIILELQRILTTNTLGQPDAAGRWRRSDEDVTVVDNRNNETLHVPPPAEELPERMQLLCSFANDDASEAVFIHPVVRAIALHFMLGYDHPFVDGNGRTARALFYWCMARHDYWLIEFVSISSVIKRAPAKYVRAYLYTETDDSDLTYFLLHQLEAIKEAIDELHAYLAAKAQEQRQAQRLIENSRVLHERLNHRQIAIIHHALKNPDAMYRIDLHQSSHHVAYQTARTDLLELANMNLLTKTKAGKAFVFYPPENLREKLTELRSSQSPQE